MKIGVIREGKIPPDKRVPLSPEQCKLINDLPDVEVKIQSSEIRKFTDKQYAAQGLDVVDSVEDCDVLLVDTAGRLQTQAGLMDQLSKIKRVATKQIPDAPHEVMLVLDAGTGQNALSQAKIFGDAVGVTGITLTKLDGTAKGGIIFAIGKQLGLPIRYIGVGEQIDDLRPFRSGEFVEALFD